MNCLYSCAPLSNTNQAPNPLPLLSPSITGLHVHWARHCAGVARLLWSTGICRAVGHNQHLPILPCCIIQEVPFPAHSPCVGWHPLPHSPTPSFPHSLTPSHTRTNAKTRTHALLLLAPSVWTLCCAVEPRGASLPCAFLQLLRLSSCSCSQRYFLFHAHTRTRSHTHVHTHALTRTNEPTFP